MRGVIGHLFVISTFGRVNKTLPVSTTGRFRMKCRMILGAIHELRLAGVGEGKGFHKLRDEV